MSSTNNPNPQPVGSLDWYQAFLRTQQERTTAPRSSRVTPCPSRVIPYSSPFQYAINNGHMDNIHSLNRYAHRSSRQQQQQRPDPFAGPGRVLGGSNFRRELDESDRRFEEQRRRRNRNRRRVMGESNLQFHEERQRGRERDFDGADDDDDGEELANRTQRRDGETFMAAEGQRTGLRRAMRRGEGDETAGRERFHFFDEYDEDDGEEVDRRRRLPSESMHESFSLVEMVSRRGGGGRRSGREEEEPYTAFGTYTAHRGANPPTPNYYPTRATHPTDPFRADNQQRRIDRTRIPDDNSQAVDENYDDNFNRLMRRLEVSGRFEYRPYHDNYRPADGGATQTSASHGRHASDESGRPPHMASHLRSYRNRHRPQQQQQRRRRYDSDNFFLHPIDYEFLHDLIDGDDGGDYHPRIPGTSISAIRRLPTKRIADSDKDEDGKATCAICWEEVQVGGEVKVMPCGHWFEEACIAEWLKQSANCPVCRAGMDGSRPERRGGREHERHSHA